MSLDLESLAANPLFAHVDRAQLQKLLEALEPREVVAGTVLFKAGNLPQKFLIVASGSVQLREGDEARIRLDAPNPVGELAALAGWERQWTAVMETDGTVLELPVDRLREFLAADGSLAVGLQRGLLHMVVRKIARDKRRLGEMRDNIVATQKAMKRMRQALLEAEDTPLHAALFEELDTSIEANRRGHYLVEPSRLLTTQVRFDNGAVCAIVALSNEWLHIAKEGAPAVEPGQDLGAVLILDGNELPVRGNVEVVTDREIVVFLDTVVDAAEGVIDAHLARLQMLDTVL
jgi:CRP/FNR family cyclic AMP-dependent transcriptional regulator